MYQMRNQTTLLFVLVICFATPISARNYLTKGSSFTVKDASNSDFLISSDNTFSCGFYSFGTNAYWLSIWFTNSKDKTVVWVANPGNPVNRHGSRLTLRKDGVLLLTDHDGSTTWETNTITTSTLVERAELLNSGNLVLKDQYGDILWKSFDFPTDTLLPNQLLTRRLKLVSRISPHMFASGYSSFFFDVDNVLKLIYDGPEISSIYWPSPSQTFYQNGVINYNNSMTAMLDDTGTFSMSDHHLPFSASDKGSVGIKRRLTLDYDGNLRVHSLNESSGLWNITWQAVPKACDIHGLCGRYGICDYTPEPKCSCPPNYELTDLTDFRRGCKPKFQRNCTLDSEFIELVHVNYFGFDLNFTISASFENCKQICLGDCHCQAFIFKLDGQGLCYIKSDLFNGFRSVAFEGSTYLRVPRTTASKSSESVVLNVSHLDCRNNNDGKVKVVVLGQWVYMYSFASAIGAFEILIFVAGWWFLNRKHTLSASMEDGYQAISNQFRSFSYSELKSATGKFKEVVGRGGFGAVYKGVLSDERVVAVKKLGDDVVRGDDEFWAEVSIIGKINHMNLARMWGFCSEEKKRLLVYEFVENGSLDKHLFSTTRFLGWKERFKVALGVAKGLAYLHHECLEWVIHCDVKPENILLDEEFEPKISDFGLAKLCQRGGYGSPEVTRIRGTKGYMAPEWVVNLPITAKVDVYSYGVVILELLKGIRLSTWVVVDDDEHGFDKKQVSELGRFVRMAKGKRQNNGVFSLVIEDLVDPRLEGDFDRNQASVMIEVGLSCVEDDRNKRPSMESVAQVLSECEYEIDCNTNSF